MAPGKKNKTVFRILLAAITLYLSADMTFAEVVMDGSLGPAGPLTGPDFFINDDLGQSVGTNLFHSFDSFNLNLDESATFTGPATIENIISRVTGGEVSAIDGLIYSDIPAADFYFINPAGVIFGPHANLDVGGSFHVSTANYLRLGDSGRFDATAPASTVLTVAPPSAFGFVGNEPAPVIFEGSGSADAYDWLPEAGLSNNGIEVPDGETFSVIGGDITVTGGNLFYGYFGDWPVESRIYASGGRVNLVSVASPGEVLLTDRGIDTGSFSALGEIHIDTGSVVSTSGDPAGEVHIRGGRLVIDNARIFSSSYWDTDGGRVDVAITESATFQNDGSISAVSIFGGRAADISVNAPELIFTTGGKVATQAEDTGNAGDITIKADNILIEDNLYAITGIASYTFGAGNAGDIAVYAQNSLSIAGGYTASIRSDAADVSTGTSGNIKIEVPTLTISGGQVSSYSAGPGDSGDITVGTSNLIIENQGDIENDTSGSGRGGTISITANESVSVADSSTIQSIARESGDAGSIEIEVPQLLISDNAWVAALCYSQGNAGDITIDVDRLEMTDGGQINSDVGSEDFFIGSAPSSGQGGNITINASQYISMVNNFPAFFIRTSISSSTYGAGNGGIVTITTPTISMDNSSIDVVTSNEGDAGNISLDIDDLLLLNGGQIGNGSDFFSSGNGGDVSIHAEKVVVDGVSPFFPDLVLSRISVNTDGSGDGGGITIEANEITVREGGISSSATGSGNAGSIDMEASIIEITGGAQIDSSSGEQGGLGGNITITGSESVIIAGLDTTDIYPSGIFSSTNGNSAAGDITINTPSLQVDQGRIRAETRAAGDAGNILLNVGNLLIDNGAQVDNGSRLLSGISPDEQELVTGNGGRISVVAEYSVSISGEDAGFMSGLYSNAEGAGKGGNINLQTGRLALDDGGIISAASTGSGDAGQISLSVSDTFSANNGFVTTQTSNADGGDIYISAVNYIDLLDSAVTTSVAGGAGNGGNITIDPTFVILDSGDVVANAYEGNGGNISITTDVFLATQGSRVDASSELGIDGEIVIDTVVTDISGAVSTLPEDFLDISLMLGDACFNRTEANTSSLIVSSPGSLPLGPDDAIATSADDLEVRRTYENK